MWDHGHIDLCKWCVQLRLFDFLGQTAATTWEQSCRYVIRKSKKKCNLISGSKNPLPSLIFRGFMAFYGCKYSYVPFLPVMTLRPNSHPVFWNVRQTTRQFVCDSSDPPNQGATWILPRAPCQFFGKAWAEVGCMVTLCDITWMVDTFQMMSPSKGCI